MHGSNGGGAISRALIFAFAFASLFSFETKPWLPQPWELSLNPFFTYEWYPEIADGSRAYSSHNKYVGIMLDIPPWPQWDAEIELAYADTKEVNWDLQRLGAMVRYQFLDDIQGDPVSVTSDFNFLWVPRVNQNDPSCPYAKMWNFEAGTSVGKEFSSGPFWIFRTYGRAAIGQSTQGPPWLKFLVDVAGNFSNTWRLAAFSEAYLGFGSQQTVNVDDFDGYAHIAHRSVDVGGKLQYHFEIWGDLTLEYFYRVFAKAFPEQDQAVTLKYSFPFCPF